MVVSEITTMIYSETRNTYIRTNTFVISIKQGEVETKKQKKRKKN